MLYQGRALEPGAENAQNGLAYRTWLLRSSLRLTALAAGGSLAIAFLTWVALLLGGTAVLPPLLGSQPPVGVSPLSELAAGWALAYFSSQLVPVQLWSASPPGLAFGLGSPLLLAAIVVASFRAGLELERVDGRRHGAAEAAGRASALALSQALLAVALMAIARAGGGPLAGAPVAPAMGLPVLIAGGAAAAGAVWQRERRLGGGAAGGARGIGLAAAGLALGSALAGALALIAVLAGLAGGQIRAGGGLGTAVLGLVYLPNAAVLAGSAGLGGGPPLAAPLEAGFCLLLCTGCFAAAIHLQRRPGGLEQVLFGAGFPFLLLVGAVASRPLVSDHTLGFTPGVAFWVAAVVSSVAAYAGPAIAGSALGAGLTRGRPLGWIAELLPPPPLPETVSRPAAAARPRSRSDRAGQAVLAVTALVMAGLIALLVVVPGPSSAPTPEDAIGEQLRLESAGDAAGLWKLIRIDRSGLPAGADTSLLSQAGLAATLELPANRLPSPSQVRILSTRHTLAGTEYQVGFVAAGLRRQRTVVIQSDRLLVQPELLVVAPAPGLGSLRVDGSAVSDPRRPIAVLPGAHQLGSSGNAVWQPTSLLVPPGPAAPRLNPVSLVPALAPAALSSAASLIRDRFAACIASTQAAPAGCPQSLATEPGGPVSWRLIGDPSASAVFSAADDATVVAGGGFQMIGSYAVHIPEGIRHLPSGGGYRISLHLDGTRFVAGGLDAAGPPAAQRPAAATDSALLAAVGAGFGSCAGSNLLRPPDCPQTVPSSLFITRVAWSLDSDPLAAATVGYDPAHSLFLVSGSYSMSVSYLAGGKPAGGQSSGGYRAELFWDGSAPVLVDIVKTA